MACTGLRRTRRFSVRQPPLVARWPDASSLPENVLRVGQPLSGYAPLGHRDGIVLSWGFRLSACGEQRSAPGFHEKALSNYSDDVASGPFDPDAFAVYAWLPSALLKSHVLRLGACDYPTHRGAANYCAASGASLGHAVTGMRLLGKSEGVVRPPVFVDETVLALPCLPGGQGHAGERPERPGDGYTAQGGRGIMLRPPFPFHIASWHPF